MRLVLASRSPRRAALLEAAGFTFEVDREEADETHRDGETPDVYVARVADAKAAAVASRRRDPDLAVLGADTAVTCGLGVLGKPTDRAHAVRMLEQLSGTTHVVVTGVAIRSRDRHLSAVERTRVRFLPMTRAEIDWYVSTGEPFDKAGAYAVQGLASRFIDSIDGSYSNVVGLPIARVYRMLVELGLNRLSD